MIKSNLIFIHVIPNIIHSLSVDPRPTEQARPLSLELAHNLAAVHAIVDQSVLCALAVACRARRHKFREILHLLAACLLLPVFLIFTLNCYLCLNTLDLVVIASLVFDLVDELVDKLFHFPLSEVK